MLSTGLPQPPDLQVQAPIASTMRNISITTTLAADAIVDDVQQAMAAMARATLASLAYVDAKVFHAADSLQRVILDANATLCSVDAVLAESRLLLSSAQIAAHEARDFVRRSDEAVHSACRIFTLLCVAGTLFLALASLLVLMHMTKMCVARNKVRPLQNSVSL